MSNLSPLAPDLANGAYLRSPRTVLAGTNGEYHFDCPLDNFFLGFVGITADDFKDNLRASAKSADKKPNPRMDANNRRRVFNAKKKLFTLSIHVPFQLLQTRVICVFFSRPSASILS